MQKGGKTLITQFHLGILMKIKSNQYENCIQGGATPSLHYAIVTKLSIQIEKI